MIIAADNLRITRDADTRRRYQRAFVPMLAAAGLDMILMNVLDPSLMRVVDCCGHITDGTVFTWL